MSETLMRTLIRTYGREAALRRVWIAGAAVSAVAADGRRLFFLRGAGEAPWAFAMRISREIRSIAPIARAA